MWKKLKYALLAVVLSAGIANAQTLSDQVLLLLSRANNWTALQTFDDVTITGTCTGCGGAGGGTVTSVNLSTTDTTIFTASGGPVVGSGTLDLSLDTQLDNLVFAGPNGGGPLTPTFRALTDADIPDTITATNLEWTDLSFTSSTLADILTTSAADIDSGKLALARITTGTAGLPLVAGATDPIYAALDVSTTAITGQLAAANFPVLTGDVTTGGGSLTTTLGVTGVTAASYGSSTMVPTFTVDAGGRLTAAADVAIATNALLDGSSNSDTVAQTPTRGSLIYVPVGGSWDELVVGTAGQFLRTDGTDVAWGVDGSALTTLNGTNISTGLVGMSVGGSNANITAVNGGVIYSTASAMAVTAAGTASQCLISNGAAAPTWGACATLAAHNLLSATHGDTLSASVVRGDIIVGNSTPAHSRLAIGAAGTMLRSDGTDVSWSNDGSQLTLLNATNITQGTLSNARLPSSMSISSITVSGVTTLQGNTNLTADFQLNSTVAFSSTAPTISSGFGTSPAISNSNGTVAIRVNVGTGGTATAGVLGLPTATTGWICWTDNLTAQAANDADQRTVQTATTTTSATLENQTVSTGAAVAWTASDILLVSCFAY